MTTPKRVVLFTEQQLVSNYAALFGEAAKASIIQDEDIPPLTARDFPPLARKTSVDTSIVDRLARNARTYVAANMTAVTNCGAMPTVECGQTFLQSFAQKAFRRPLQADETQSITTLWNEIITGGGSPSDAIQYGVYGILLAPGFTYRTEFGSDTNADGALAPHELASALSYFITDGPPDADLTTAAAANQLSTADQIRAHADRLLASPAGRTNFEAAMLTYFALYKVQDVSADALTAVVSNFTVTNDILNSLYREGELFLQNTLWAGPLSGLVNSRRTWVNSLTAPIYGVPAPSQDPMVFMPVELTEDRAGVLTLASFLTTSSRPSTGASPIIRGLTVNMSLVCQVNPPFPEEDESVAAVIASTHNMTQKEQYDVRKNLPSCAECHTAFDAFGMVLEPYDAIGRYRTMDPKGNVIDANWTTATLSPRFGGGSVTSARELAQVLTESDALNACMTMNLMNFALADVSMGGANLADSLTPSASCAVKEVVDRFKASPDQSFSSLIKEIAASQTIMLRSKGRE